MILTNEQLRATLRGALEIEEIDGRLAPRRFGRRRKGKGARLLAP